MLSQLWEDARNLKQVTLVILFLKVCAVCIVICYTYYSFVGLAYAYHSAMFDLGHARNAVEHAIPQAKSKPEEEDLNLEK